MLEYEHKLLVKLRYARKLGLVSGWRQKYLYVIHRLGKMFFNILYLLSKNLVYLLSFFSNAPLNNYREPENLIR